MGSRVAARGLTPWYPKRARAVWRKSAPVWVCDVFDDGREGDRYTVFLTGEGWIGERDPRAPAILCDEAGRCQLFDLVPHDFARYRRRNGKRRVAWITLPEDIRDAIVAFAQSC